MIFSRLYRLIRADALLLWQSKLRLLLPLFFFALITTLFPLAVSPEKSVLRMMAPGILWIAALLATILSIDPLFHADTRDGSIDHWFLSSENLVVIVGARLTVFFGYFLLPLILLIPCFGYWLGLPRSAIITTIISLILGTPPLLVITSILSALTRTLANTPLLLTLVVLPLLIPTLIFATGAISCTLNGESPTAALCFLAALTVPSIAFGSFVVAACLRITLE